MIKGWYQSTACSQPCLANCTSSVKPEEAASLRYLPSRYFRFHSMIPTVCWVAHGLRHVQPVRSDSQSRTFRFFRHARYLTRSQTKDSEVLVPMGVAGAESAHSRVPGHVFRSPNSSLHKICENEPTSLKPQAPVRNALRRWHLSSHFLDAVFDQVFCTEGWRLLCS
jgi:hypothetical protein